MFVFPVLVTGCSFVIFYWSIGCEVFYKFFLFFLHLGSLITLLEKWKYEKKKGFEDINTLLVELLAQVETGWGPHPTKVILT